MADSKISALALAAALTGSELFLASQGAADVQATIQRLKDELQWSRPADWPAMPATAANTMHMLAMVQESLNNRVAIRMSTSTGTWSVDWGDGTTTTGVASNATAEKTYDFTDVDLPAATSRGYKVAVITITAATGNFTVFNSSISATGLQNNAPGQILEMQINGSSLTSIQCSVSGAIRHPYCEHVNIVACGTVTSVNFFGMTRLQKLTYPSTLLTNLTSIANVFGSCSLLQSIDLTGLSTSLTSLNGAFGNCASLRSLVFPSGTLGAGLTDCTNAFAQCTRLSSITFPSGAFSAVTNALQMFQNCALGSGGVLVFPSGAFAALVTATNMFSNSGFRYIEFPSALTAVTNISGMMGSAMLNHVKFASGGFGSVTTAGGVTVNPGGLCKINNFSVPITFTLVNSKFEAAELDEIYTALPTITSQTITVSGNPGTSADTPSIATGKGWTVTG